MPDTCLPRTTGTSRRQVLTSAGAAAALAIGGGLPLSAQALTRSQTAREAESHLLRTIPSTGEAVPAVGLGTFLTFDRLPGQPRDPLFDVIRTCWEGGARVVDTSPLYGTGEITVGDGAAAMKITDQLFMANKIWATGDFLADESHARRSLELSEARLWRNPIDLMQVHSLVNVDVVLPYLRAWKKEGRIRYTGVTHHENPYHQPLLTWVERGDLDFVQVNYSIFNRAAETRIIPAARDNGVAVAVNMPFEKARLFKLVEGRDLPDFAKDFGAFSWAGFFLKYILSNPDVTVVLPATSDPVHAAENIAALRGPLPDRRMRSRMTAHMESLPGFNEVGSMPWYPDKTYAGLIGRAQAGLRARS